jgi:DNA-binding response OmpR family regulator
VDDEKEITDAIEIYLSNEGLNIIKAYDGIEALNILINNDIHLIVMDIMMPKLDGLKATFNIRKERNIPIIILSAKSEDVDKIMGLNMGADDYMTKPFNPLELIARVKSQLRRYVKLGNYEVIDKDEVSTGGLRVNRVNKTASMDGEDVKLTPREYKILNFLMSSPGRVFSIDEIYEHVWNEFSYNADNTVAVHIRRIREKIEIDPKEPKYLKVVWGVGYKIERQK